MLGWWWDGRDERPGRFTCSEKNGFVRVAAGKQANAEFRGWHGQKRNWGVLGAWGELGRARRERDEGREEREDETKADKG